MSLPGTRPRPSSPAADRTAAVGGGVGRAILDRLAWLVLALPLALLAAGAATADREDWPAFVGDETTYLMAAASLAFDGDLAYSAGDFERFVARWGKAPEGLILQRAPDGRLTYGKPFFYPLAAAPFVRLAPRRGAFVANALLLAAAAFAAALALRGVLGGLAPLWVAAWIFASVTFVYVFWAHADLFLASLTAVGLALVFGAAPPGGRRRELLRWAAAGALLAVVASSRPFYAGLFLPALLALRAARPAGARRRPAAAFVAGAVSVALVAALAHAAIGGSWTSYGGERRSFSTATGFPEVDLPPEAWDEMVRERGNASWLKVRDLGGEHKRHPGLWGWNLAYLAAGRHVGLLPYFLPLLLGFAGRPRGAARWCLPLAVLAAAAAFLYIRPFNFWGGGGAIANRYLLPVYPAFWLLVSRRPRRPWGLVAPLAAGLLAAPFLLPLWSAPGAFPLAADWSYRWVTPQARELLPYETTQSHLKPAGREDVAHGALWVKLLSPAAGAGEGGARLTAPPGEPVELLVGSPEPLAALRVTAAPGAAPGDPGRPEAPAPSGPDREDSDGRGASDPPGAAAGSRRDGAVRLAALSGARIEAGRLVLDPPRVHPMWWDTEPWHLYLLELRFDRPGAPGADSPVAFSLEPAGGSPAGERP